MLLHMDLSQLTTHFCSLFRWEMHGDMLLHMDMSQLTELTGSSSSKDSHGDAGGRTRRGSVQISIPRKHSK